MKKYLIKLLGGYHEGEILSEAIQEIYDTVREEDLFRRTVEGATFEGKPMSKEAVKALSEQAKHFSNSRLFKVLDREIKYHVDLKYRSAANLKQLETAGLLEYTWDVLKNKLNKVL